MSRVIPPTYTSPNQAETLAGSDVLVTTWTNLIEGQNYQWSRTGLRCPGRNFNPPWATTSTAYVQTANASGAAYASSTDYSLGQWEAAGRLLRPIEVAGAPKYRLRLAVYGRDLAFSVRVWRFDRDSVITDFDSTTLVATDGSGEWGWYSATLDIAAADAHQDGNAATALAVFGFTTRCKAHTSGDTAEVFSWFVAEDALALATEMPSGG